MNTDIAVKGAIGIHHTPTSDAAWDAAMMMRDMGADPGAAKLRQMHAWVDSGADATNKGAYKFPHHMCSADGTVGAANLAACSATVGSLNGARGGSSIPDGDRRGVWLHVGAHLKDGKREVPPLKMLREVFVKSETDTAFTLAGWAVVYGGQDLTGDTFTKETDYWLKALGFTKPFLYDHGFDDAVKTNIIGYATLTEEEDGLWFEAQIEKANRYAQQVHRLAQAGVLGASTGAVPHLVRSEETPTGYLYKSWPIAELSGTVMPAEPRTLGVDEFKALATQVEALKGLLPEETEEVSVEAREPEPKVEARRPVVFVKSREDEEMEITELAGQVTGLATKHDELSAKIDALLKHMEDTPAIRNAGYISGTGGATDKTVKSVGDFLIAIRRRDVTRLVKVYGSVKDLSEGDGTAGGYLVPPDMKGPFELATGLASKITPLVRIQPVTVEAGTWPALDQYVAPTAGIGDSALAGGVVATATAEAGTLTETTPGFVEINWRVHKIGGYTLVSNELIADSPTSIEGLLTSLFGIAIAGKREHYILNGNGAGEPLGMLNCPAVVAVAPATDGAFAWVDAMSMLARFKQITQNVRWIMHPGVLPDLGASGWVTGNVSREVADLGFGPPITSEHMPQANYNDVLLADLGAYVLFVRQELTIAYSEHSAFLTDKGTWRFTERLDGQPWLKGKITLADPQGSYTVSPYVVHADA